MSTPTALSDCSIEVALHTVEMENLERLGGKQLSNDFGQLTAIQNGLRKVQMGRLIEGICVTRTKQPWSA